MYTIGQQIVKNVVTAGASLDHCHVPGRAVAGQLAPDEAEIGYVVYDVTTVHNLINFYH